MTKGTPSKGLKGKAKLHIRCRRCGNPSFHKKKKICSYCGFGKTPKIRKYAWQKKSFFKRLNSVKKNKTKKTFASQKKKHVIRGKKK